MILLSSADAVSYYFLGVVVIVGPVARGDRFGSRVRTWQSAVNIATQATNVEREVNVVTPGLPVVFVKKIYGFVLTCPILSTNASYRGWLLLCWLSR